MGEWSAINSILNPKIGRNLHRTILHIRAPKTQLQPVHLYTPDLTIKLILLTKGLLRTSTAIHRDHQPNQLLYVDRLQYDLRKFKVYPRQSLLQSFDKPDKSFTNP